MAIVHASVLALAILPTGFGSLRDNLTKVKKDASQSLAADFKELGCYKDSQELIMTDVIKGISNLTKTSCAVICKDFPYYGLKDGDECWCGDYTSNIDLYGESDDCDIACTGNSNVNCGGNYAMRVFTQASTDGDAIGCFGDSTDRVFSDRLVDSSGMTPEVCYDHCNSNDALYYGTQWGEECWCGYAGDDYDRLGSATCDRPCSGDPTLYCGGAFAMTVYEIDGTTEKPPTPVPSPVSSSSPMPVSSPTPVMTIPDECTGAKSAIRWASGTGISGRMYLEDGGCGTMTDLYKARVEADGWTPKGPIYILDDDDEIMESPTSVTGKWLLTSELFVLREAIFYCRGTSIGGDCDELRIQSTGPTDFHEVRGHGGSLYFEDTVVTSWDTPNKRPQEEYEGGRSFLNCVSEYESDETCVGQPKNDYGECRMDIIDSEMGYLGWFDSESYGLTWKVRGFCADKSNPEVFDTTNVYGDIKNSDIHHMYYGMYSYGHQGGVWTNNKMHDNHQYGFDPHDDSDYVTIANNEVYNNENHGIIASKRCNNVKIYGNEIYDGGEQAAGIFLHRSSDSCEVYDNNVYNMQDAGLAILESFDADIHDNTFSNVKYGIRISLGGGNNMVHNNVFDECSKYGLYTYQGSNEPEASSNGRPGGNSFYDNTISNTETGVKIKQADNTVITGNTFTGTSLLRFDDADSTAWSSNTFEDADSDLCYKNIASSTFASTDTLPPLC